MIQGIAATIYVSDMDRAVDDAEVRLASFGDPDGNDLNLA